MIKAIIFDCYGVLLNDSLDGALDVSDATEEQRARVKDIITAANWGMLSSSEAKEQMAGIMGFEPDRWGKLLRENEGLNLALFEYIAQLRRRYKIAVLSNVPKGGLSRRFSQDQLDQYFDVVVESGELGISKPDPRIYQFTLEKLGVLPDEALFTDDRDEYCAGAEEVGISSILYTNFGQFKQELELKLAADTDAKRLV